MEIRTTYIGTLNGINGIWCGFKPDEAVISEEKLILYPDKDCLLKNKFTEDVVSSVCLLSAEQQSDWNEIPFIEEFIDDNNN